VPGVKKLDGATEPRKEFDDILNRVDTICQRDEQTDLATAKTALMHSISR